MATIQEEKQAKTMMAALWYQSISRQFLRFVSEVLYIPPKNLSSSFPSSHVS